MLFLSRPGSQNQAQKQEKSQRIQGLRKLIFDGAQASLKKVFGDTEGAAMRRGLKGPSQLRQGFEATEPCNAAILGVGAESHRS